LPRDDGVPNGDNMNKSELDEPSPGGVRHPSGATTPGWKLPMDEGVPKRDNMGNSELVELSPRGVSYPSRAMAPAVLQLLLLPSVLPLLALTLMGRPNA